MNKIILLVSFFIFLGVTYSNAQFSKNSIQVIQKSEAFDEFLLDQVDFGLMDTYRAEYVDNKVVVEHNGQFIEFALLSAEKCRNQQIPYDAGLVKKGEMMGTKQHIITSFKFELNPHNRLADITVY